MSDPTPTIFNAAYWFDPIKWWMKTGRFLNLIEDNLPRLSITGVNNWLSLVNNVHALGFTHDPIQVAGALAHGAMALVFHTIKRGQLFAQGRG